jgi:hypothetical protein
MVACRHQIHHLRLLSTRKYSVLYRAYSSPAEVYVHQGDITLAVLFSSISFGSDEGYVIIAGCYGLLGEVTAALHCTAEMLVQKRTIVHSRRRDSDKQSKPRVATADSKEWTKRAVFQCTHCIRTHVNLHSDFGHTCNGTRIT